MKRRHITNPLFSSVEIFIRNLQNPLDPYPSPKNTDSGGVKVLLYGYNFATTYHQIGHFFWCDEWDKIAFLQTHQVTPTYTQGSIGAFNGKYNVLFFVLF